MRQIVLDTETTGLEPSQGHRIIEIGCVELVDRKLTGNNFHQYLQPDRQIDLGAIEVHGITNEFLADKPRFKDVAKEFIEYIRGAELVIHNAPFDVGFMDHEFKLIDSKMPKTDALCSVCDTLSMARRIHPGQRNSLDALCKRYEIDNAHRTLHGALLDAEILADVYLRMTGGQVVLGLGGEGDDNDEGGQKIRRLDSNRAPLPVIPADAAEMSAHETILDALDKSAEQGAVWRHQ